jgi:predicted lactoylglutathione lyase
LQNDSVEKKETIETVAGPAAAAVGEADPNLPQYLGCMFSRSVEDPDRNVWEILWMSQAA